MSSLFQDIKFALRLLIKDRSFTITALLTLAVCIGANTAMFTIVRSVLLKPLPFPDSDRLILLSNSYPNAGAPRVGAAVPDFYDRLTAVPALDQLALFRNEGMTYGDANGAERLTTLRATPSFFPMVGARAVRGRLFSSEESDPGKDAKVLLSYGFWQQKFGGSDAIGHTIRLNGQPYEVIGVLSPDFTFLQNDIDLFLPAAFGPDDKADSQRHSNNWQMIGHVKPGASIELVREQVDALNAHNDERFPNFRQLLKDAGFHTIVVRLNDDVVRDVKSSLYLLWGGVLFVLVIGCVNIANLVIVRSTGRTREMATRHAIGGDLVRLARQLVTETTLLAVAGGVLGVLLGWWALRSLSLLNLDQLPRGYEIHVDAVSVAAILGLSAVVGVLLGVAPAVRLWRMNLNQELREETRGGSASRRATLWRSGLAAAQVAIALVLLIGAGLLLASFRTVLRLDLGFQPDNVTTASVSLPGSSYEGSSAMVRFEQSSLQAIRAIPGVEHAAMTSLIPFSGNMNYNVIMAEGHVRKPGESLLAPTRMVVSAGFFETMGVTLALGRFFDSRDTADATKVAIIDDRLAELFWPGKDAVGRRLYRPGDPKDITKITPDTQFFNVVGVVKEMRLLDPRSDVAPVGVVYFPYDQAPDRGAAFVVKTDAPRPTLVGDVRRAVARIDPQLPVFRVRTMQDWIDRSLIGRRVPMVIASAFAAVALFLAAIGIYGVLAYGVVERRRELGVRLALGGTTGSVFRLVLSGGAKIVGIGLVAGLVGAYFLGGIIKAQLFGIEPMNPVVLVAVTVLLSVVALVASILPAWRASRTDPIVVLGR